MNDIMQRLDLTWPEKLGALAYLCREKGCGEADMPVSHRFTPGWYIREMFIPQGTYFIGRAHKLGHRVTLDSGRIRLISEHQQSFVEPPFEVMTVPGFQTVFEALTDVYGSTYHPNPTNSRNIDELEDSIFYPADDVFRIGAGVVGRFKELTV